MHWTATLRDQNLPQGSRVAVDLKCNACGYNLRYASVVGKCPECGEPVKDSLIHLSLPTGIVEGLREIAYGSIVMLVALLFYIPPLSSSMMGLLGVLALAISSVFRLLGSSRMRFKVVNKQKAITVLINLLFVFSVIEILLVVAVCIHVVGDDNFSVAAEEILIVLFGLWVLVATAFLVAAALTTGVIAILTGYSFIKQESRVTILALIIGGVGVGMAYSVNLIFQQTWWIPNAGEYLFSGIFVLGILLSFLSCLHAANAAERTSNHIEELIEKAPVSSNQ